MSTLKRRFLSTLSLQNFNWPTACFVLGYHAALLVGLPFYFAYTPPSVAMVTATLVAMAATSLSISTYHRAYSHRGYTLNRGVELIALFFGTAAFQGSALKWSHDHRKHHKFVDTNDDPYAITKGFWYAHWLWLFEKPRPREPERYIADLLKRPILVFQDKYYIWLAIASNLVLFALAGLVLGDMLGAFVMVWWVRVFFVHHATWFVNSLAHSFGERTYSRELSARDNYLLAFATVGEGYHNYHHVFPTDYRNGVRWYHFDPAKWMVWCLNMVGLAHDLKRYPNHKILARLLNEDKKILDTTLAVSDSTDLHGLVQRLHERLHKGLSAMGGMMDERGRLRTARAQIRMRQKELTRLSHAPSLTERTQAQHTYAEIRASLRDTRRQLREMRKDFRRDWKQWLRICGAIKRKTVAA